MNGDTIALLAVGATQLAAVVAVAGLLLSSQASMRAELREIRKELSELRERMARLEGIFEGFARSYDREPA